MARYPEIYKDKRFKRARRIVIQRDNGLCQHCLQKEIYRKGTEVHHIIELTEKNKSNPMIAFGVDNLELLCVDCHNETHSRSSGLNKFVEPI